MTLRDKIMDTYWLEFLETSNFQNAVYVYENAYPLEACFWEWFRTFYMQKKSTRPIEDYLK